jgi:trans-cinnamate 4-monooxygenase
MVIPMLVPHRNLKAEKLLGYDIPAGSRILVNAWGLANNPKYWERPEAFNPDRFLGSKLEVTGNDMTFIPFGVGRRSCPGSLLALPILGLILGRLVQEFELLPPPGVDQLDLRAVGGQLSLSMAVKSRVVLKPIPRDS